MKKLIAVCAVLVATAVLAEDKKAEAQAKINAAMAKSCELTKKNIVSKKDICVEEAAVLEPLDCNDNEARKKVEFLKLGGTCLQKEKDKIKADNDARKKTK